MWSKKKNKPAVDNPLHDKAAKGIAGFILKVQMGFARFMEKRTARFGRSRKIVLMGVIVLVFGGLSVRSVVTVFTSPPSANHFMPEQIRVPEYEAAEEIPEHNESIPEDVMEKIKLFRIYMDSLNGSSSGQLVYDSILLARPGLMDSIKLLEEKFNQQQKK